jgi:hypothetical protein
MANTLAYYSTGIITVVKSLMIKAPVACAETLFGHIFNALL